MQLSDLFYYDETSYSCLRRKTEWRSGKDGVTLRAAIGDATGSRSSTKTTYYDVYANGRLYRAHVVVWILHNGEVPEGVVVDHINGNSLDNRLSNLRLVSNSVNARNQKKSEANTSGVAGVSYKVTTTNGVEYTRWIAQWHKLDGKRGSKSFSIERYGNAGAFKLACEYRQKMIDELNAQGAGYTERHGT